MQVLGALRHAMPLQIAGRRARDTEDIAKRDGNQLGVRQRTVHGDHHVMPFG